MQIFPYGQKIRVKVVCVVAKIRRDAAASTVFYFAKSRQDLGLGSLASRGGPATVLLDLNIITFFQ